MRPLRSGGATITWRSKRPARSRAESSTSGRLVAAMMMTLPSLPKPSISTSRALSVDSRSSVPPLPGVVPVRARPMESSSSRKMIPPVFLALANRFRTRAAPTPTNISVKSEPAAA